jgi:hypothetical protein
MLEFKGIATFYDSWETFLTCGRHHHLLIGIDGVYEMTEDFKYEKIDVDDYECSDKRHPIAKLESITDSIYLANFHEPIWNRQQCKMEKRNHYWVKLPLTGEWICTNRLANARRLAAGNSGFSVSHGRCIPAIPF